MVCRPSEPSDLLLTRTTRLPDRRYTYLTTGALPSLLPCTDEDGLRCLDRATGSNIEILILAAPSSMLLQHPSFDGVQAEQLARLDPSANGHAVQSARLGPNPAKLIVGSGKFGCLCQYNPTPLSLHCGCVV